MKYTLKPGKTTSGEIYRILNQTAEYQCQFCRTRGRLKQDKLRAMVMAGEPFACYSCKKPVRQRNATRQMGETTARLNSAEILSKEYVLKANNRQCLMLTINCHVCSQPFSDSYATLKRLDSKHTPLRCVPCREKAREAGERLAKGSVSQQTRRAFYALSPQQQVTAETIIKAHVRACVKLNVPIDSIDRAWIEAIELAQMKMSESEPEPIGYEPTRRYPQYQSPRETSLV